jgi:hypothetical protein
VFARFKIIAPIVTPIVTRTLLAAEARLVTGGLADGGIVATATSTAASSTATPATPSSAALIALAPGFSATGGFALCLRAARLVLASAESELRPLFDGRPPVHRAALRRPLFAGALLHRSLFAGALLYRSLLCRSLLCRSTGFACRWEP